MLDKLNIKNSYYPFVEKDWRFNVLDGNDLSFYGTANKKKKQQPILFLTHETVNIYPM